MEIFPTVYFSLFQAFKATDYLEASKNAFFYKIYSKTSQEYAILQVLENGAGVSKKNILYVRAKKKNQCDLASILNYLQFILKTLYKSII